MAASFSKRPIPGASPHKRPSKALSGGVPLTGGFPSSILLQDNNGKDWYFWFDTNGSLRFADASTVETAGFNFNTGGSLANVVTVAVPILASSVDIDLWIAPQAAIVLRVTEIHSVVGGAAAAVRPRKITDGSAPGAAASGTVKEITTAAFDLTSGVAVNTKTTGTLSATASDYTFAAGDRLALDFSGTLTGLVGRLQVDLVLVG